MKKKLLSATLALILIVGTLAGCGDQASESKDNEATETTGSEVSATEQASDDLTPITLEYYNADGNNGNWDNPVGQAITAATGVTLDISYPVSSQGDPKEDVALMIASNDYPDLIFAKDSATDLYEAGAYIDMTDLIEEYGPNIKKMYGEELSKLKWGNGDDGIYQLSYAGVNAQTLTTGGTAQLTYAALEENNWNYPTTISEYEEIIKNYIANHPTTEDGLDTIGITISASDWHWMITLGNPAGFIADAAPDNGQWLIDDNYNVTYKHVSENEKEYFKWLSRMYDEGILDPNFATQTDDDYIAKISSGRVVGILDAYWHYGQANQALIADGKEEFTFAPLPVTLNENQKAPTLMYQGLTVGYGIGISTSCEDPVRAIKFLDFLCSDEGAVLYKWGVEGINYEVDENGNRYRTKEEIEKSQSDPDYAKNTGIGNYMGFPIYGDGAVDDEGNPYTPTTRASVIADYNDIEKKACESWGVEALIDIFPQPSEFELMPYSALWAYAQPQELSDMQNLLDEIAWPALVKCVSGGQDNFEANWKTMCDELEANGMEAANEAMTEFLAEKINN